MRYFFVVMVLASDIPSPAHPSVVRMQGRCGALKSVQPWYEVSVGDVRTQFSSFLDGWIIKRI